MHAAAVNRRKCCYVETRPLASQAVANRASLQAATDEWISELASPLPGNAQEKHLWEVCYRFPWSCLQMPKSHQKTGSFQHLGHHCQNDVSKDLHLESKHRSELMTLFLTQPKQDVELAPRAATGCCEVVIVTQVACSRPR